MRRILPLVVACTLAIRADTPRTLQLGVPIDSRFDASVSHVYLVPLTPNQHARVVVQEQGVDLVVTLFAPDGRKLGAAAGPSATNAVEAVSVVSDAAGDYRVEVRPFYKDAAVGAYSARVEDVRPASARDRALVTAEHALLAGEELRLQGKADAMKAALARFEEAAALYREAGSRAGEGDALVGIGRVHDVIGDRRLALQHFEAALDAYRQASDSRGEANALNYAGLMRERLGERKEALGIFERALPLARQAGDGRLEGQLTNNIGLIHAELGDRQTALQYFERALPLHRAVGNRRGEANTLTNLAGTYSRLGAPRKALDYFTDGLALWRTVGEPRDLAAALNGLGVTYYTLDEFARALACYREALVHARAAGERISEAATLHNIANIYEIGGDFQAALDHYRQALPLQRAAKFPFGEGNTLTNLGRVHSALGQYDQALDLYTQALALHRSVGNRSSEAVTLTNLGAVTLARGDAHAALGRFEAALSIQEAVGDRLGSAQTMNQIGYARFVLGEPDRALEVLERAADLHRAVGSRRSLAFSLVSQGRVQAAAGNRPRAVALLGEARALHREVADRAGEASALHHLARAEADAGDLDTARAHNDEALRIVEALRRSVTSHEFRATYLAAVRSYYDTQVDVLMRLHRTHPGAGFDASALEVSERGRARALLDLLSEAGTDIRQGVDPALLGRERGLQQLLNARADRYTRVLSGKHTPEQARDLQKAVADATSEYEQVRAQIRSGSPRYAALTQPEPLRAGEVQELLDADTALVEFTVGEERSYAWRVTRARIDSFELPGRATLDAAARRFHALMTGDASADAVAGAAAVLADMLRQPLTVAAAKRLVIVADGALHYVPFGALPVAGGAAPLIETQEIVNLPSASALALVRRDLTGRPAPQGLVAVLADPVFEPDDPRIARLSRTQVTRSRTRGTGGDAPPEQFPRLIGSRREAAAILALVPPARRKQALDFEASRETATAGDLARYRLVHFATHGVLDTAHPELSGVVLSLVDRRGQPTDGFLRLHDLYNLKLPVDLVVLSACQTALGREIRGEGLIGLTRGFMYAGVPRIVASLWKVDDRATAELMKAFYAAMLGPRSLAPAAALREAQLAVAKRPQWQAPYYWAGFVLLGEWR